MGFLYYEFIYYAVYTYIITDITDTLRSRQRKKQECAQDLQSSLHLLEPGADVSEIGPQFRRLLPTVSHATNNVVFTVQVGYWRPERFVEEPFRMNQSFQDLCKRIVNMKASVNSTVEK